MTEGVAGAEPAERSRKPYKGPGRWAPWMLEVRARRKWLLLGVACLVTGTALLGVGVPFVRGWLAYLTDFPQPPPLSGTCRTTATGSACQLVTYIWVLPSLAPVLGAYAIALPAIGTLAGWMRRAPEGAGAGRSHRFPRTASTLLFGATGWMGGLFALGFVLEALAVAAPQTLRYLFLASLLAVPSLLAGVGGACLIWAVRRGPIPRSPDASG